MGSQKEPIPSDEGDQVVMRRGSLASVTDNIVRRASFGVLEPLRKSLELVNDEPLCRASYSPREPLRIIKNMIMLGLTFTLIFTAFMAMANLQSSINSEASVGVYSLAALYGAFLLSSLFLPPFLLAKLKSKWTLLLATTGYIGFLSAQYYPKFETLVPAALYLGTCSAPMWAAQATYLTLIAEEYSFLKKEKSEAVLQRFFGIFFLCFHSSQVWGNLISSSVLSSASSTNVTSMDLTTINLELCGANYCPGPPPNETISTDAMMDSGVSGVDQRPESSKINMLIGIFLGCAVGAALVIYFLVDSLKRYGENERKLVQMEKWNSLLIATIKHWQKPTQILVIPISVWLGIQEAFIGAEFTKAYIACAWGVENIGYVMMCFGVCAATSSLIIGKVMEYCGRPIVFLIAALLDVCCLVTMLNWTPNSNEPMIFFVISGVWGIADGVWSPQIKALYGTIFSKTREAAFSNAGLWLSIGFIIVYLNAGALCMETKLYAYLGFLIFSFICYAAVEVITIRENKKYKAAGTDEVDGNSE